MNKFCIRTILTRGKKTVMFGLKQNTNGLHNSLRVSLSQVLPFCPKISDWYCNIEQFLETMWNIEPTAFTSIYKLLHLYHYQFEYLISLNIII